MHGLDHVGPGQREVVEAAFPARAAEIAGLQLARLQLGAHAAVEEEDALAQQVQESAIHGQRALPRFGNRERGSQVTLSDATRGRNL